jgi:hypothetical protein
VSGRLYLLCLVAAALLLAGCGGGEGDPPAQAEAQGQDAAVAPPAGEQSGAEEPTAEPLLRRNVEIYYPSSEEDGLVGELHEIFNTATPGDRAKQIIADLISGPDNPGSLRALPPATRLRQVYVLDSGVAYLDFSADLTEGMGGGSKEEILAVYSVVNSVAINIPEILRVGILVNGRTLATLNGHLDLRRPLSPDFSLIKGSIIVARPGERPVRLASAAAPPGAGAG